MEPITQAILLSICGNFATDAIRTSYVALKKALTTKYGEDSDLILAVNKLEEAPDSDDRKETLEAKVKLAKANNDSELLQLAHKLHKLLDNFLKEGFKEAALLEEVFDIAVSKYPDGMSLREAVQSIPAITEYAKYQAKQEVNEFAESIFNTLVSMGYGKVKKEEVVGIFQNRIETFFVPNTDESESISEISENQTSLNQTSFWDCINDFGSAVLRFMFTKDINDDKPRNEVGNEAESSSQEKSAEAENEAESSSQEKSAEAENEAESSSQEKSAEAENETESSSQEKSAEVENEVESSAQESEAEVGKEVNKEATENGGNNWEKYENETAETSNTVNREGHIVESESEPESLQSQESAESQNEPIPKFDIPDIYLQETSVPENLTQRLKSRNEPIPKFDITDILSVETSTPQNLTQRLKSQNEPIPEITSVEPSEPEQPEPSLEPPPAMRRDRTAISDNRIISNENSTPSIQGQKQT
ncbi:MAG: hypothetical protein QNJ63_09765 [Calothrix sp. MO_192.B10]|nr:hypothetical protein [Calothrix sp. MO_192.B10]